MHGISEHQEIVAADNNGDAGSALDFESLPVRVREIATLRGLGYTFREIGGQCGLRPQAVSLMLQRHRRSLKSLKKVADFQGLSARAANVLGRHGIRSRDDCRSLDLSRILQDERNCGRKTIEEIVRWLQGDGRRPEFSHQSEGNDFPTS